MKRALCSIAATVLLVLSLAGCERPMRKYQAEFFDVFDTHITLTAYAKSDAEFEQYRSMIYDEMLRLHQLFDIYNDYEGVNNLKTVNDSAGVRSVAVDPAVLELLELAREGERETRGAVNAALGPVLKIWHDYREAALQDPGQASAPPPELLQSAAEHTSMEKVVIDREAGTLFLTEAGMRLDVGALAKGYAAGAAVELAKQVGMTSALLDAGGNVVAVGAPADGREAWSVGVQSPEPAADGSKQIFGIVKITDLAVVSSGDYQRFYEAGGTRYHHIIDPQTLRPAAHARAVTVLHPDSATADLLSTACFVLPYEEGRELLERYGGEGVWMLADGSVVYTGGYPAF